jgi:nitrite reductase/ring-hydroxylating ferredoxin subunit
MERRDFIEQILLLSGCGIVATCANACTNQVINPNVVIDFVIDLSENSNKALLQIGGYVIKQDVIVAKTSNNEYVAASVICSHQGEKQIRLVGNQWVCSAHLAAFDIEGKGLNKHGEKGLPVYKTSLNGNLLRVFTSI